MSKFFDKLKIGICSHSFGVMDFDLHGNQAAVFASWGKKYNTILIGVAGMKNAQARECLVAKAAKQGCTHIVFIDTDHEIQENLLPCLLKHMEDGAAMASGLICKRGYPYPQVGFIKDKEGYYLPLALPLDGHAYQVDVCAFGCTIISMDWLSKLDKPYFRDTFVADKDEKYYNKRSDVNICEAIRAVGGTIIIDTASEVGHMIQKAPIVTPSNRHLMIQMEHILRGDELKRTSYQTPVYMAAGKLCKDKKLTRVIDLGCGDGEKLATFVDPFVSKIIGLDQSEERLEQCHGYMPQGQFLCGLLENGIPFDVTIEDLIICADVLEHLEDPAKLLSQIPANVWCIFSTPDISTIGPSVKINEDHKQSWTQNDFETLLKDKGFTIESSTQYNEIDDYKGIIVICRKEQ